MFERRTKLKRSSPSHGLRETRYDLRDSERIIDPKFFSSVYLCGISRFRWHRRPKDIGIFMEISLDSHYRKYVKTPRGYFKYLLKYKKYLTIKN